MASAKTTGAAVAMVLAGATLAACGPQLGASGNAAPVTSPVRGSASAPPSASAPAHGTRPPTPSRSATPSAPSSSPARSASPTGSASGTTTAPAPSGGHGSLAGGRPGGSAPVAGGGGGSGLSGTSSSIDFGVPAGGSQVALTFDDGPDPRWTPQVLALLAQHHAKATFCEIGPNAQRYPYLVKEITATGNRLCDHSVHHNEQQSREPYAYNVREIADAQQEIAAAAGPGAKLWYYRAPGGDFSPQIRTIAADHGLRPLGWNVDANDWRRPGVKAIMRNIDKDLRPGSIILMHDGGGDRTQTIQALARLLDQLDARGYTYTFPAR